MNMTMSSAKRAVIRHKSGRLMQYDPVAHRVYLADPDVDEYEYYVFPSKREAKSALHHTVELDKMQGKHEPWNDYEMIEMNS